MNKIKLNMYNITSIFLFVISILLILITRDEGIVQTFQWIGMLFCVSFFMRPMLNTKQLSFTDGGFSLSLGLGVAITFLGAWFVSATKIASFNTITCILSLLLISMVAQLLCFKNKTTFTFDKDTLDKFIFGFTLFMLIFSIAFWIKGFSANVYSTEKFMDFGFMQSMYRQEQVPPEDMWYSNTYLNYYYLGQAIAVYLCRLAFVTPEYGYNFMLCTLFSVFFMMSFSLVESVLGKYENMKPKYKIFGGIMGACATTLAGNGHWIIYGIIIPFIEKITGKTYQQEYWFPNSTRFIGYNPDVPDKTIHEFPSYSFILGDLHAHVCNVMFTLPLMVILFDYAYIRKKETTFPNNKKDLYKELFMPHILLIGLLIGLYQGCNYWDFPIYFIVSGAIILFSDLCVYKEKWKCIGFVLLKGALILVISTFIMIPFNIHFDKMASTIRLCDRHTPLWQLAILWLIPLVFAIFLIVYFICENKKYKKKLSTIEWSLIAFALCGIGLIFVPEFIYIEDIYGSIYARSNTMFKLTYQAFIILGLIMGFAIGIFLNNKEIKNKKDKYVNKLKPLAIVMSIVVCILSFYSIWSCYAWFGNVFKLENREGISATRFLSSHPDFSQDFDAIEIINKDTNKHIRILEGAGDSYTAECKMSVFTGASTVIGWHTHEWLWKDDLDSVNNRTTEVQKFYEYGDINYCAYLLYKYDVDYIYIGTSERDKYTIDENGFATLGTIVWEDATQGFKLLKVDKELVNAYVLTLDPAFK